MKADPNQIGSGIAEGFVRYTGTYQLPSTNTSDLVLGKIQYTVTCDGITETYESGNITCKKSSDVLASNPGVTPDYGEYIDVGSGYIVEIITFSAETFDGTTNDDILVSLCAPIQAGAPILIAPTEGLRQAKL